MKLNTVNDNKITNVVSDFEKSDIVLLYKLVNWNEFAVVNGVVNAVASSSTDDVVVDVVVDIVGGRK